MAAPLNRQSRQMSRRVTERSERDKKRREKFAEFISAHYEHEHCLDRKKNITAYGETETNITITIFMIALAKLTVRLWQSRTRATLTVTVTPLISTTSWLQSNW